MNRPSPLPVYLVREYHPNQEAAQAAADAYLKSYPAATFCTTTAVYPSATSTMNRSHQTSEWVFEGWYSKIY